MDNAPWSHEFVSFSNFSNWVEAALHRFPRLSMAIRRQGCFSSGEAAGIIRALKDDHMPLCEAAFHYTGDMDRNASTKERARKIIRDAIQARRYLRSAFGPLK